MGKVKYQDEKYKVSRGDKLKVWWIEFVLFLKRWKRRVVQFIAPNGGLYLIIVILWILFGILIYFIGIRYHAPDPYTVWDVVWELKIPFFTSLILAGVISGYAQATEYRDKIKDQFEFYMDSLEVFDSLFEPFLKDKSDDYMPFFNEECVHNTMEYISELHLTERDYDNGNFKRILNNIQEQLDEIKNKAEKNSIVGMNKLSLERLIKDANKLINSKIQRGEENKCGYDELNKLAWLLLYIIAEARRPWRWDIENNKKILEILEQYEENDIKGNPYYNMHLYGHKLVNEDEDA